MTDGQETAPDLDWTKGHGLLPCIVQDATTGNVLMLAYMNPDALEATRRTGHMHYWSRSRGKLWKKGEESGHTQEVVSISLDCDGDTLLAKVRQTGPACHTGEPTCFYTPLHGEGDLILTDLWNVLQERKTHPKEGSHTTRLLGDENLRLKKIAEEAAELIMAAKDHARDGITYEAADLLYHTLVLLAAENVQPRDVLEELARRRR